jgi:hypothetical protein
LLLLHCQLLLCLLLQQRQLRCGRLRLLLLCWWLLLPQCLQATAAPHS